MPQVRTVRDLHTFIQQVKHDYESQQEKSNVEFGEFIQRFHLSQIKFAKRYLFPSNIKNIQNNQKQDINFPDLLRVLLSLIESEKICNRKKNITNKQANFIAQKRSKSQIKFQRELNKLHMIEVSHDIIAFEDGIEEDIKLINIHPLHQENDNKLVASLDQNSFQEMQASKN